MDLITKDLLINFLFILLALCLLQILYMATYAYRSKELKSWQIALFPIIYSCIVYGISVNIQMKIIFGIYAIFHLF